MGTFMRVIAGIVAALAIAGAIGMAGFAVRPKPLEIPAGLGASTAPRRVALAEALPAGLPAPVRRFYEARFPDGLELVDTVVFAGRGRIRPFGVWMPARFIFTHEAGKGYRHYIEATWFGLPFLRVDEGYVDGASFFESPMGTTRDDPNTNQGANLALWAEAGWFPSIWITDPRVRWVEGEATGTAAAGGTATLEVPYGAETERFIVKFDPATGLIDTMEAMRFREAGEGKPKIRWITRNAPIPADQKDTVIARGSATWEDQGGPWAYFDLEQAVYGADLGAYLRARGR